MLSNIAAFTKVHLLGSLGINELFHPSDEKRYKRARGMLIAYLLLSVLLVFMMTVISTAMAERGMAESLPALAAVIASVLVFILNVFQSGSTIFNLKLFESEAALPVTPFEIVASRFSVLYIINLLVSLMVTVPPLIVCGMNTGADVSFVLLSVPGVLLIPMIPLTIASVIGAFIYAVSARMKQRKAIGAVLGMVLMLAFFVIYFRFMFSDGTVPDKLAALLSQNYDLITGWYPPAELFSAGLLENAVSFAAFAGISVALFAAAVALVSWKYLPICQAMQTHDAKHNYVMQEQTAANPSKALFKRDLKRYFSSTPYIMNTMFGYILMAVFAVAMLLIGVESVNANFGGLPFIETASPFVLAILTAMSSTTCASISIEGKHWWITQTLPIPAKKIFASKLKVNFAVALPFYLISVIILTIATNPSPAEFAILVLLPLAYIYFMSVLGLYCGIKRPFLDWESETDAVKRGSALAISLLVGTISVVFLFILTMVVWAVFDVKFAVPAAVCVIVFAAALIIHRRINRCRLSDIA